MNLHQPQPFISVRPPAPAGDLPWYRFLKAIRTNALGIFPQAAYEDDVVVQSALGRNRFVLNSPDAIHHLLVDNIANYRRTSATIRILRPIIGDGLFLAEGEDWRHQRRTIAPALAPRVMPMLARHVVGAADETIARLTTTAGPVDILATTQFLALEIAARSMFSLEMQQYGAALRRQIGSYAQNLARPYLLDLMLPVTIPTLRDLARARFRASWLQLMDEIMAARLRAPENDPPRDLFDLLRAARDPQTGAAFSQAQLRDQMTTMVVAGHETTALALFWAIYLLASAPAEQERLAEEVRAVDFTPDSATEVLNKLTYTRAVVNEALRLYPPAFAITRAANGTDRIGTVEIPAGSLVMVAPFVLHRHVRLWRNPDAFEPARFLGDATPAHRFAYLPFGVGPRVCVGAQFALTEAALVLAMLIKQFRITRASTEPVLPVAVITTAPDHPALFRLQPRT
ncbi:MAG: cytochrome P450 [Xanthobacteraceae bacterium]|nr:cytochrome P450 [Xanthobacteraceae bacterium]